MLFRTAPGADAEEKEQEEEFAAKATEARTGLQGGRVVPGAVRRRVGRPVAAPHAQPGRRSTAHRVASSSAPGRRCSRSPAWRCSPAGCCCATCGSRCCTTSAPGVCLLLRRSSTAYELARLTPAHPSTRLRPHDDPLGADSEVGRLRTVMLHRPGPELKRLTPRNNDRLLFDGIPWVSRAQDEHDAFAEALRDRDVEVLYLIELLVETLAQDEARAQAIEPGHRVSLRLGDTLRDYLDQAGCTELVAATDLTDALTAGRPQRRGARRLRPGHQPAGPRRLLIDPLPNLLFTRDSSVWIRDQVAVTSPGDAGPRRARRQLTELIYTVPPALRRRPTGSTAGGASTSRAATCCCSRPA